MEILLEYESYIKLKMDKYYVHSSKSSREIDKKYKS